MPPSTESNGNPSSFSFLFKSPVSGAFSRIQWDALGSLKLTAQETALLRMAETNPMDYTLADSRDASMYARVLLKLIAEATAAGAGNGQVSRLQADVVLPESEALQTLNLDPLGVVSHYALSKLLEILQTLSSPPSATTSKSSSLSSNGVTVGSVFYVGKEGVLVEQWKALLRLLNKGGKGDVYAQKVAALCLTKILIAACPSQRTATSSLLAKSGDKKDAVAARPIQYASAMEPLEAMSAWIVSQLKNSSGPAVSICTPALKVLMDAPETRTLFCHSGGIKYLSRQLRAGNSKSKGSGMGGSSSATTSSSSSDKNKKLGQASVQQLYEMTFCMWLLTYELNTNANIRADFAKDGLAVQALVELVSVAPREKVVRVALSALRNLATCTNQVDDSMATSTTTTPASASGKFSAAQINPASINGKFFLSEMIAVGLMKAVEHLRERQFTDPDLVEDVTLLHRLLNENYKEMSRWEVYKNEVESGHLQWGSTHTEAFFKENARMMEGSDADFHLLKVLIALLSSRNEEVAAIACFDIGEFVRHYPNGRAIAKRLGAKELVMPLIEHENPELQRHALQCVSKIMVNNWEHVK